MRVGDPEVHSKRDALRVDGQSTLNGTPGAEQITQTTWMVLVSEIIHTLSQLSLPFQQP